ncbi:acetyltransferase [Deinococcus sp. KSM4-11]|uniref:acetyltransferase n=1 Tax=Deinococcus sp. KSM4-11 TaxID=2568654 RepID=UPI0010A2ECC1|nr:acetyltransferase [Deinococcus sp. KSM4-11]THF87138.1 acetyltransferase [Deinococcus sp. KSM4-11]
MSGTLIVGAGGHAKVVLATLQAAGLEVRGILDDRSVLWGQQVLGVDVLGGVNLLSRPGVRAVIAIGSNAVRRDIAARYPGVTWMSVCHPTAVVDASVHLGAGSVVFASAVVQPDVSVGCHVIVNTGATVDHDSVLGDYVHVAPGTHLAGNVHLEDGVFMGIGSVAVPGVRIGAWSTVGAGGVVVHSLPAGIVAMGLPARIKHGRIEL